MTRLLITGASGLMGAHLLLANRERHEVGIYLNHELNNQMVATRKVDLRDREAVSSCVASVQPNWTVHRVARTNVDLCETNPEEAYRANVVATENIARAAARWNARVLYISTDSVFDGRRGWYREGDLPSLVNTYAATKPAGEQVALGSPAPTLVARTNFYD
jgi:dTDP-4-dehydrorhamnose reductase